MNRLKQSLSSISAPTMPSFGSLTSSSAAADRQTSPPLEQERLDQLAARQELSSALLDACSQLHRALAKERPDPRNTIAHGKTKLPVEWVARVMQEGAEAIKDNATRSSPRELQDYARVVGSVGEMHEQLTSLSASYHEQLAANVLATLERRVADFKDWDKALKDAEKKRSTLDAIMAKIDKGKKDPAEYEQDLDTVQWAYTDACQRLQRRADQLDEALDEDRVAAEQLVEIQLEYARSYVTLLEDCSRGLSSSSGRSGNTRPVPARPAASASTRMARSQSESSVTGTKPVISPTIYSVLGPNRSRGNSVTSDSKDGGATPSAKNRSRSGSVLDRFAFGGRGKRRDSAVEDDEARPPPSPRDRDPSSPSRFNPSLPTLPTLGSLKKLSIQSNNAGGKYGSLGDSEEYSNTAPPSPSRSTSSSHPPPFRRAKTDPMLASSGDGGRGQSPSPTSASFRRVPAIPAIPSRKGPIGRLYRAQWAYTPPLGSHHGHGDSAEDEGENEDLALERGTVVRIEEEITADWWRGVIISGGERGRRGMLPSAYVVPHDLDATGRSNGTASEERWRSMTADDAASSAPETSSDGHGLESDTDGDEGLLPEARAPTWSIGADDEDESPFGDDRVSHAQGIGRMSRA